MRRRCSSSSILERPLLSCEAGILPLSRFVLTMLSVPELRADDLPDDLLFLMPDLLAACLFFIVRVGAIVVCVGGGCDGR